MRLRKEYLIIAILLLATIIGFWNLGKSPLSFDEAEIYLASQNIFTSGVPQGFYRTQFYENSYLYESNSSMYAFEPTNYIHGILEARKGWLPYYMTAFFSIFSKNEFWLRTPFVIMWIISLFFFYLIGKKLFNENTSIIASFFFAISPALLFYGRMLRYYSPMLLLIMMSIFFYTRALDNKKMKDYLYGSISLGLLFHVNALIFLALGIMLLLYWFIAKTPFRKEYLIGDGLILLLTVPWILATGFLKYIGAEPSGIASSTSAFRTITAGINNNGLIFIFFYLGIILLLVNIFFRKNIKKTMMDWDKKTMLFLLLYFLCMILIPMILVPQSSFEQKLFVSIIPFALLLAAKVFDTIMKGLKDKLMKIVVIILILAVVFIPVKALEGHDYLKIEKILTLDDYNWMTEAERMIAEKGYSDAFVLMTSEQLPFMFYTNHSAQIVWPVRKEFINQYKERLVLIEREPIDGTCNFMHLYKGMDQYCGENKNYLEKLKDCDEIYLNSNTKIHFCEAKLNGGFIGLFSNDFEKDAPPDFIWDHEPFPVRLKVENLGEQPAMGVKAVFTGVMSSSRFDQKGPFYSEDIIEPGESIIINMDEVVLNHKLAISYEYLNVSVIICYPYVTRIKINICSDNYNICSSEISGAPVQITDVSVEGMNYSFTTSNVDEGFIGDFESCEENSTKKVKISSDAFKCSTNRLNFKCEGLTSRITQGESYLINVEYGYQQEFKKAIMLRSQELNKNDYETFKKEQTN